MPMYHFALKTQAGLVDIGSIFLPSSSAVLPVGLKLTMDILAKIASQKSGGEGYTVRVTTAAGVPVLAFDVLPSNDGETISTALH